MPHQTALSGVALAVAQAAIDYSKQPPRDLQLEAGTSLAIAGFIITFVVLGIFTLLIKATSLVAERIEARKAATVEKPQVHEEKPEPDLLLSAVAVAVAHIRKRASPPVTRTYKMAAPGPDPWVLAERISANSLLETRFSLEEYEKKKWRE